MDEEKRSGEPPVSETSSVGIILGLIVPALVALAMFWFLGR